MNHNRGTGRIRERIKRQLDKLPYIRTLKSQADLLAVPPGHFYSPVVAPSVVEERSGEIWNLSKKQFSGLNLDEEEQLRLLNALVEHYPRLPFRPEAGDALRYHYDNPMFGWSDGILLFCMMLAFRPRRIVEVGSGYSSALMLDTNERFFDNHIDCTFIDPRPARLRSLLRASDIVTILDRPVQEVDRAIFGRLEENDFLFIDSSHVSKTGSDVNYLMFEVLPELEKGVKIHFHDIFWPFEYPQDWVTEKKRSWNESYLLRAFLSFNEQFRILLFGTFLMHFHRDWFSRNMPLCLENTGGSIWLEKAGPPAAGT